MDLVEILALIASLSGEPDMPARFETIASGGSADAYPISVAPCPAPLGRDELEGETIICGTVSVPERRASPEGNRIDLFFTVMRAHSMYPDPDPMLHLHGGPGGGIVSRIELFADIFEPIRSTRDVIMFDQRSSVLSSRSTTCRSALDTSIANVLQGSFSFANITEAGTFEGPGQILRDCVAELEAMGTDLSAYNTRENANDAVALMEALGYDTYNVHGISYGTRLTLEILRSHPDHVRSAVIDGVAPLQVALYDTLALPPSEALDILIEECAADETCNAAFPDLREVLSETIDRAVAGELVMPDGTPLPAEIVVAPVLARNGTYADPSAATALYPAFVYELARLGDGQPTPILDLMNATDGIPRHPSPIDAAREGLLDVEIAAQDEAVRMAEIAAQSNAALDSAIDDLREVLVTTDVPLARIFDDEMVRGAGDLLEDPEATRAALIAYGQLREGDPDPGALRAYVTDIFPEASQPRLLGLIDAMTEAEVAAIFDNVERGVSEIFAGVTGSQLHLWIYACQESVPFNSIEGFRETSAELQWPVFGTFFEPLAQEFFAACEAFTPIENPGFHDPVVSDIPVLSIGSTWDTQTAPSWPALAAETLSNSQTFMIPEAGHGSIAYQECVADMTVAFLDDPMRQLSDTCPLSARPEFHIP